MKPSIYLLVGRIGSGKTTYAKQLESETGAIRFTHDEWMHRLLGPTPPEDRYRELWHEVEDQIWQEAEASVRSGTDVILDFGFWTRESRNLARERAVDAGAIAKLHYVSCSRELAFERTMQRSKNPGAESLWIDEAAFEKLDALFEPIQEDEQIVTVSTLIGN